MTPVSLKLFREHFRITQDMAAKLVGVSLRAWQKREQGKSPINLEAEYTIMFLLDNPNHTRARIKWEMSK